ncbi:MAG: hypothetical protein KTR21_14950 [Rhodobacteraceae bacterium]|nr:hypothetical protein [Paracoccaceae bacterium]
MKVFLLTFDLHNEDVRPSILAEIKNFQSWAKLTESSYTLVSERTAKDLMDNLFFRLLGGGDQMYIIELGADWRGRGPKEVIQWLQDRSRYA